MADADPVQPGGDRAGWISGSLRGAIGGARTGGGLVAGAVTIAGGAVTAVAAPVQGGAGYPASARFEVEVQGDGSGAVVLANTNSAGSITSFSVVTGGQGYTSATVRARMASTESIRFDMGPDWDQYPVASVHTRMEVAAGLLESVSIRAFSDEAFSGFGIMSVGGSSGVDAFWAGLSYRGSPSFQFRVLSRFISIDCAVARTAGHQAIVALGMYVA